MTPPCAAGCLLGAAEAPCHVHRLADDGDAGYAEVLARIAAGTAPRPVRRPDAPPVRPLAETLRLMAMVKRCEHRSVDPGCGCSGARCALGKGRGGVVSHLDCLACVSG